MPRGASDQDEAVRVERIRVVRAEDVVKGDTTSSVLKDATLETGLVIKVPAFIKVGDVVSVDTSTGEYRERKK